MPGGRDEVEQIAKAAMAETLTEIRERLARIEITLHTSQEVFSRVHRLEVQLAAIRAYALGAYAALTLVAGVFSYLLGVLG